MAQTCETCGRTLGPIDVVLSRFCRECADNGVRALTPVSLGRDDTKERGG